MTQGGIKIEPGPTHGQTLGGSRKDHIDVHRRHEDPGATTKEACRALSLGWPVRTPGHTAEPGA